MCQGRGGRGSLPGNAATDEGPEGKVRGEGKRETRGEGQEVWLEDSLEQPHASRGPDVDVCAVDEVVWHSQVLREVPAEGVADELLHHISHHGGFGGIVVQVVWVTE